MSLSTGIIGLPNVGKSTLFNAITNSRVEAANYPFATIEPNVGIVNVNDIRMEKLCELIEPNSIVYTTYKFVDIAGLVAGASKGEGLGNKFLQNIREVDSICHVVRCFDDSNITHVNNSVDPIRDLEIINLELILADLEVLNNRISKIAKKAQSGDKTSIIEKEICDKLLDCLKKEKLLNTLELSEDEKNIIKSYNLLTLKPVIYVANIDENSVIDISSNTHYNSLCERVGKNNVVPLSVKLEFEISLLDKESKIEFMKEYKMEQSGLDKLVFKSYTLFGLSTFFTYGKKEVRAWTFKNGMLAPECAGIIHSDFQRGFIKAEIIKYDDLISLKSENAVKESGKLKLAGKDYVMQDGDICTFRFNV
ncbi:redox-regulated ATPase YchF [Malacoplasma muris]|uniref:redox-regulated ATPase YchF n=1 Tax=Malacoplasma muris TaxID=2119 RepID=UPI00398E790E